MSHEIRTPMTAVLGFADADMSPGERQEAVHTIHRNGSHLLSILDDIVGMSEFAGELTISRGPCSPIGTVWEAVDMMRARAQTKGIELLATCAPEVPEAIVTDATRVRQVLLNLVGNAIKFTARGHVSIHVRPVVVDDAVVPGRIAFDIADSGIGMTAEQQRSVFRAFEQADASTSRRFGGTGLGLSICQRIAALLGGEIRMQSVMGEGSRFTFEIEARACEDALLEGPSSEGDSLAHLSAALAGVHVLVADPVGDASDLIETILRSCGALVAVAHDGRTVSERVMAAWRSPRPIDVVVIDMLAAEIDGCSTVRLLREAGYDRSIVGLSASTLAADRERCREAGCDAWVGKPFRCATLVRTVANAATRHSIERAAPLGQAATGAS
jgi:CheY-like chemotaxis protein